MIDNHRQQQQQQLQEAVLHSKICPEDLQLMDDVIGWGATGVVRKGVLIFRGSQLKVSFYEKLQLRTPFVVTLWGCILTRKSN